MSKLKKILIGILVFAAFSMVAMAQPTRPGGTSPTTPGALCLDDSDTWILCESTFTFGDTSARIAEIWATLLNVTTAVIGGITSGDVTISDVTPALFFKDTDATAGDNNASFNINCTDVGNGTEDCDITAIQQVAGADTNWLVADADGAITFNAVNGVVLQDSGITALQVQNDGTLTTLLSAAGDYTRIGDAGTTSQGLAANDDLLVSGVLETNGAVYIDGTAYVTTSGILFYDAIPLYLGSGTDSTLQYSTVQTPDSVVWGVGADSKSIVIADEADKATDFAHALQTNPTIFIQSADQTTVADYISIAHDQTDGQIASGAGGLILDAPSGIVLRDSATTAIQVQNDGTITTLLPAAGDYTRIGDVAGTSHALAANDDLLVTGILEADGTSYFDGTTIRSAKLDLLDNVDLNLGTGEDVIFRFSTVQTPDTGLFGLGAEANSLVMVERGDMGTDFAHALQTNPTLFIQSADQTTIADYVSIAHDQTDGRITTGAGNLSIGTGSDSHTLATPNDLFVSGQGEFDGALYADAGITVNGGNIVLGNDWAWSGVTDVGNFFGNLTSQTVDSMVFSLATGNRSIMMIEQGDQATNFGHTQQANPTLFIQSSDATTVADWISLAHDQTNGVLAVGGGAIIKDSGTATITASTTQTQGNGALTTNINEVSVVANANDTVTLPTAAAWLCVKIINNGANTLQIFPASGDNLGAGADTATTLASGSNVNYCAYNATNWESF